MRANRQLHDEVIKYFYKNWRLFVRVDSSPLGRLRQGEVCYQGVRPTINSATLELLKELEIRVHEHLVYLDRTTLAALAPYLIRSNLSVYASRSSCLIPPAGTTETQRWSCFADS